MMMMKKVSSSVWLMMVLIIGFAVVQREVKVADAVSCNAVELSPCLAAITSSAAPSGQCCTKLREQRPCLCGYLRNPNLSQYVNSPNARRVAATCGVPFPTC